MGEWLLSRRQADRSQARSAWVAMQRRPRPGGTVEVIVSPTPMMFDLILDLMNGF
jgi:hypothetical protein